MDSAYIVIIILIILIDYYIFWDTNSNIIKFSFNISKKPKIIIIGGQHGNEPSGSYALYQIHDELKSGKLQLKRGELHMFPFINKYGSYLNYRYIPSLFDKTDLNRIWYINKKSNYSMIENIKLLINDADLVIDAHEGWGYHISNPNSMGSCIFCTHKEHILLCNNTVNKLNKDIDDQKKLFLSRGLSNDLLDKPSLRTYCAKNNIPNILIETSGQNNIQPLKIRQQQQYTIIIECLKYYNMI